MKFQVQCKSNSIRLEGNWAGETEILLMSFFFSASLRAGT